MTTDYRNPLVYGVVVVVYCSATERFLLLTEKYAKPAVHKKAGIHTFVCETAEVGETVLNTVHRALLEEVGLRWIADEDIYLLEKPLKGLPHRVRVFPALVDVGTEFEPVNIDVGVEYYGWFSASKIREFATEKDKLRCETIPALDRLILSGIIRQQGDVDA